MFKCINRNENQNIGANLYYSTTAQWAVTVTDAVGCQNTYSNIANTPTQLLAIGNYTITPANNNNNGSISIQAIGGTAPYTYLWNTNETTAHISNVASNWYAVTVTDTSVPQQQTVGWYWVPSETRGRMTITYRLTYNQTPYKIQGRY